MTSAATDDYLRRLGLGPGLLPTLATMRAIHRAHLETLPYDNLDIMLGRPPSVLPVESLERIARTGRAGYCFHQNGALETVLLDLGFDVERRRGHVWTLSEQRQRSELNHLALVVAGLPTDDNPEGRWWPDVGLGEGFLEPLPLAPGTYDDGPFTFRLDRVDDEAAGWSFTNDPSGTFTGVEARGLAVDGAAVAASHASLSTAPDGKFTKFLLVLRRDAGGVDALRGCTAIRVDATGRSARDLTSYDEWRGALDTIGLATGDVEPDQLHQLFDRSLIAHQAWDSAGRP